jgi:predicted  nucleic acid-binding Zn-ribbon protein
MPRRRRNTIDANAIWDDESGTPPPMTAAEMDKRLEASTERMRAYNEALENLNRELESIIAAKAALIQRIDEEWRQIETERATIATQEKAARHRLRQLLSAKAF